MRRLALISLAAAALGASACTATRPTPPPGTEAPGAASEPAPAATAAAPTASAPPAKIQTTAEANRASVEGAAEAPLRDLNVLRTKIPDVLLDAVADPYARPPQPDKPPKSPKAAKAAECARLAALVAPLDDALGPDLDNPANKDQGLVYRGKDYALGMMAGAASDVIPFRSWVRKLSGAERHDKLVQNAITAGAVRRAYLKGLGEAHGCNPPATPSHTLTEQVAEAKAQQPPPRDRFKPVYPIR